MANSNCGWTTVGSTGFQLRPSFTYTVNNSGSVTISNLHVEIYRSSYVKALNWYWGVYCWNNNHRCPASGDYVHTAYITIPSSGGYADLNHQGSYPAQCSFTIPADKVGWSNGTATLQFTGYFRVENLNVTGTVNGRCEKIGQTVTANTLSGGVTPSWSVTLNYSSNSQYAFTINVPSGGSGSYTYSISSSHCTLNTSNRQVSAESNAAGYTDTVFVHATDTVTGATWGNGVASVAVTMNPRTYAVSYNSNGTNVSNMPSNQTKTHGRTLTLSSTKPTRTGYTFSKWNTASNGSGTSYNAGASYTANAAATLYAQWTGNTLTVNFNSNGGSGNMSAETFTYGTAKALTSNSFTAPLGYTFGGWATSQTNATAGTVKYTNSQTVTNPNGITSGSTTLYAIWKRTINFYSGLSKANNTTRTQYYDGANSKGANITTPTATNCTDISGWTELGWRDDTTAGAKETNFNTSISPSVTSYYAVYSRTLTMTYANGGGTGTAPSNTTVTQYYNSSPKISSPSITLATNTFSKEGYNFTGWDQGGAGASYTWSIAVGDTDITRTATAQWSVCKVTIRYNVNGGTIPTGTGETRYRVSSDGLVQKSTDSGGSWTTYTTVVKLTDTYKDILNVNNTNIGLHRIGYVTIANKAWNLKADGTGSNFHQADSAENTTNKVTTKRLNGGTEITSNKIITLYANWQFRGSYIYKNDTDKWVKVVPFVYDGTTWRETQPFIYTSNGWKSLIN